MKYERTIMISPSETKYMMRVLQSTDLMGEDDTITHTVSFGNDMEMDIKICGARDEEPWTEVVLFQNGSEVGCSEPEDSFDGEWCLEDQGDSYVAHVVFIRNHCELEAIYRKAIELEHAQAKKMYEEMYPAESYGIHAAEDSYNEHHWLEIKAAETLTGLTSKDIESAYAYEACTGKFEFGWIPAKYYEGLKYGQWVTDDFISYVEDGHYEIDPQNKEYKDYLEKKMIYVINALLETYPECAEELLSVSGAISQRYREESGEIIRIKENWINFYKCNPKYIDCDFAVLNFINDIVHYPTRKLDVSDQVDHMFCAGYCYYFAVMLKAAFQRGEVCWSVNQGHIVWKDNNGIAYDITGVYEDYSELRPVEYLGDTIIDFMHNGFTYHTRCEEFSHWCEFYKTSEIQAMTKIWSLIPDDLIKEYDRTEMKLPEVALDYWAIHKRQLAKFFRSNRRDPCTKQN